MGWVPATASREKAYIHLNNKIPDDLKFDLNCLFVTHGKLCQSCTKKVGSDKSKSSSSVCPLAGYCCIGEKLQQQWRFVTNKLAPLMKHFEKFMSQVKYWWCYCELIFMVHSLIYSAQWVGFSSKTEHVVVVQHWHFVSVTLLMHYWTFGGRLI